MNHNKNALTISNLTIAYQGEPVLSEVNASIDAGVLLAIIGPNGAGKTTLLKSMIGLIKPANGTIALFGKPIQTMRKKIAYVPQRASVDWDFPIQVIDVVVMGCYGQLGWFARPGKAEYARARMALERVGMLAFSDRPICHLSGGQQQRVFIARALMQDAECYLLDEPFNGIDTTTEHLVLQLLQELRDMGKTIVVVHHDLHTVQSYFDWALLLKKSALACGPIETIFTPTLLEQAFGSHARLFAYPTRQDRLSI